MGLTLIELATGRYPIPAIEDESLYFSGFSPDRDTNLKEHITAASEGLKLRLIFDIVAVVGLAASTLRSFMSQREVGTLFCTQLR
ncbi:unnamed protein product [Dibothriocephalus latus]|uniref:Uncharacterized protein n=1 Tax=Dibothriocephalus latus TaxID=60516 RepID=A0A3P7MF94_DIBLA|nr:unnamed protein product [Dibothriocephalus latus]